MQRTRGAIGDPARLAWPRLARGRLARRRGAPTWALAGLMLALAVPVAAPVRADTLPEALAKTYETNPTLAAARAALRASNERVPQALANWGPVGRLVGAIGAGTGERPDAAGRQPFHEDDQSRRFDSNRETAR